MLGEETVPETIRVYPACCMSMHCGRIDCERPKLCPNLPILAEFKRWVEEHDAVVTDPVWSPSIYTARK